MDITTNFTGGTPGVYASASYIGGGTSDFNVIVGGSGEVTSVTQVAPPTGSYGMAAGDVLTFNAAQFGGGTSNDLIVTVRAVIVTGKHL